MATPAVGRLHPLYPRSSAADGITTLSISNSDGQSLVRFITNGDQLVVDGRISGFSCVLSHEGNARAVLKGLLKLLAWPAAQVDVAIRDAASRSGRPAKGRFRTDAIAAATS